jgi:hypothetical protein
MMVEYCCYEPAKFTYLIYRVEHAASPAAERAAFRLADRWGRVWELNRISEREHLPKRVQHLEGERILELEWLENWPSGTPYRAYRKVLDEHNMKVFDHGKRAKKVTGVNAGGRVRLPMRRPRADRIAQSLRLGCYE